MTTVLIPAPRRTWASLNGSRRGHHAHAALIRAWKDTAILACRAARLGPVQCPVTITATVHRTSRRRADASNVMPSIKASVDALVHCGVIPDDDDRHVTALRIVAGDPLPHPTLELTIEETP